ncbi:pilus assembly protein TadG-related protein [Nocardioides ferulae]|uniref:pilus assembly protein TadG-related protein n=1 Tax=Nocardioides ferulae TaxID=2340821 RepID=UPI000EB4F980|nr:pilus assembly protein TadG-related protein [Nocardioides ferulae]
MPRADARPRRRDERGQVTLLIIGFAFVLAVGIAVVVDATAAYLQRQGLDTLADGAALHGADLGATGEEVYTQGLPPERLRLSEPQVRAAVARYLQDAGAYAKYPGLRYDVAVDAAARSVTVSLEAPLDLPLTVPGSPGTAMVGADGAAVVSPDDAPG